MCRSFETSVTTGIYSYLIAAFIWWRNSGIDRQMAMVIFVFSTIQIFEAMIWWSLDHSTGQVSYLLNRLGTTLIPIVLVLELLTSLYVMSYYIQPTTVEIFIYLAAAITIATLQLKNSCSTTLVDPKTGSLLWGQRDIDKMPRIVFLVLLVYPLLRLSQPGFRVFGLGVIATFLYAWKYDQTFGSNWCWTSNILSTYALITSS